jgi:uncharacterized membrane protein
MHTSRLEAFSDGVLAIIITIMVLELRTPDGYTLQALWDATGVGFLTYVLSFVYIGIYWNNHHHVFQLVDHVSGSVMWANLHLLFWLSLYPFTTGWMAESDLARTPTAVYAVNLLLAGAAYFVLETVIMRHPVVGARYREAVGRDTKGLLSVGLYAVSIGLAMWQPKLAVVPFVAVAVLWLVPDPRIERYLATHDDSSR